MQPIDIDHDYSDARIGSDLIVDGRTARRQRNKNAVLDALIGLANEGEYEPPIDRIADRAGVSYRSVYRYFEDRTDLMLSAIARVMGHLWPIFDIDHLGEGPLEERIERLVSVRVDAYRRLAPVTRSAVHLRANEPLVAEGYDRVRRYLRDQLARHFGPELAALDVADRDVALAALDTMFQFEALEYLAMHQELGDRTMASVLAQHVRVHLTAVPSR